MTQERQNFDHSKIEQKWQEQWEATGLYRHYDRNEKEYILDMFPYPSGAGLHVGHPKGYIATDVVARMKMLQGKSVLHPMGWDAFGLPAENYAIKNKVHPAQAVEENINVFKRQLGKIGFTHDWQREVNTTDPAYYRWTQWIFLKLFERGLAYEADEPINWCPSCKTGLANEDLEDGKCERCGSVVEQKKLRQWKLRMTAYADRLLEDLDPPAGGEKLDWAESIKIQQRNWIGRSEGITITYAVEGIDATITVFTTRPDTNFGATFIALAPDGVTTVDLLDRMPNKNDVQIYIESASHKTELERISEGKKKTGVFTGLYAINQLTNRRMPIYVSDFVLGSVGTGVVVGVPGHDMRDFEFAQAMGLEIIRVVVGPDGDATLITRAEQVQEESGTMVNSSFLDGLDIHQATKKIMDHIVEKKWGKRSVHYKMRDWVFSRQRYWGEPIPIVHCDSCKTKKYHYVLIHGFTGNSQEVFLPWLKAELERQGHSVFCPDLPNTDHPSIDEQVEYIVNNTKITPDTILIGHSLGGVVMAKLLEKISTPVRRSVFVDPVVTPQFNDRVREDVKKSNDWKFDYGRIKANAGEVIILADANYPIIRSEDIDALRTAVAAAQTITIQPQDAHFVGAQEPEILRALQSIGTYAVKEEALPVTLPTVEKYEPTGTGESPLAGISEWVNVPCPRCGAPARRETNTMPQWAGSSWYYLRYMDPHNETALVGLEKEKEWMPVDLYVGGAEHATRHLLYARFWHKFLFDIGAVSTIEPFKRLVNVGMILAEDGRKMSKRWNNVINPDDVIAEYGADSLRLYEMFLGPFTQAIAWNTDGVRGVRRFLDRVWALVSKNKEQRTKNSDRDVERLLHQTIKKVTDDIDGFRFNTAVSQLMILLNAMESAPAVSIIHYSQLLILLSPFAPHITEELWHELGNTESIFLSQWPTYDAALAKADTVEFVVQINGKARDRFSMSAGLTQEEVERIAFEREGVKKWMEGKELKKKIFVQDKILNIVI